MTKKSKKYNIDSQLIEYINLNLDHTEKEWQQIQHELNKYRNEINILKTTCDEDIHQHTDINNNFNTIELLHSHYNNKNPFTPTFELDKNLIKTFIPGYPILENNKPEVGEFVVFMADMRNSSSHFQHSPESPIIESGLQRVFYEISALIPAIVYTAAQEGGQATELLGDGVLILFHVEPENRINVINKAYKAARKCVNNTIKHVNDILWQRYNLPPLKIGIGLAYGESIIKVIQLNGYHPKIIGQCVWEAAKLSYGENAIGLSKDIQEILKLNKIY
ncbi:hypothetical protein PSI23_07835 [Xenorhabdus sp. XENO-10]|uniref:Guanylate cyclase domain-containing protein n=1 Tax=Xenorhabdus yunnanensis TaxID=3025878 RepID=A0ABT5LDQ5_9GAMM|nr:hypothetical protein [Xenorhabdus yunnanensis]MDC9589236.1 hypothetical protein [Xenorhabdus yunnanensis]